MFNLQLRLAIRLSIALSAGAASHAAGAQEVETNHAADAAPAEEMTVATATMTEVEVIGRLSGAAVDIIQERIEQPVAVDLVSAEQISKVGDSTVSLALRRLPGVTLVGDQFIYIRGLGERFSSTTVNGAYVPSPDITRNVIPLDIFPAEIIESISIQKGYTADRPAAFGGGNVDIRTRSIPDRFALQFQVGTGWNSESSDDGLTYAGGGDDKWGTDDGTRALPAAISQAIQTYRGDFNPVAILQTLQMDGQPHTIDEAEAINRQLATSLKRDNDFSAKSMDPDLSVEGSVGNKWTLGEDGDWRVGFVGVGDYKNQWRNRERITRSVLTPDLDRGVTQRTINNVSVTGSLSAGLEFTRDHAVNGTGIYLRNTEDEAALTQRNNFNFRRADGRQLRDYRIRFEERDLMLWQAQGKHVLGEDTLELLGGWLKPYALIDRLTFTWYYSDAKARTDIPSEVTISAVDTVTPDAGAVLSSSIRTTSSAADYRFTELEDQVESYGWKLMKPIEVGRLTGELSGGLDSYQKARIYLQTQLGVGTTALLQADPLLAGSPSTVFADANVLNPANRFLLSLGGIGTESYLAAEVIDAGFAAFDLTWDMRWRLSGGVRREQFQQLALPVDQLQFDVTVGKIPVSADELSRLARLEEDYYPTLAMTYMAQDFWAEEFQLRLGWSQTTARPDIREVSDAAYIDPFTDARVRGNPELVTSEIANYDLRAEWFFANRDNLTLSLFYKDIAKPIETVEGAGTDNNLSFTFINADSAEVYGVELEWFKDLSFVGGWADGFFTAGNITLSDSEITLGDSALRFTNNTRPLTQHSENVFNVQLGYDSPDGYHSAVLVFNSFSERLLFAGRGGAPDAYEQPFQSLDVIYTWYPTERWSFKLRAQNLLRDNLEVQQGGVVVLEQEIGVTSKFDVTYRF
jgi:TonB-dependent receptor